MRSTPKCIYIHSRCDFSQTFWFMLGATVELTFPIKDVGNDRKQKQILRDSSLRSE